MTDEEAKAMLAELSKHYKQPVKPISEYCAAFRTWMQCIQDRADRAKEELFPGISGDYKDPATQAAYAAYQKAKEEQQQRRVPGVGPRPHEFWAFEAFADDVRYINMQISKSALLDRLLYCGEEVRTEMCPTHKGTWSGLFGECEHGCQLTGWIPKEKAQ